MKDLNELIDIISLEKIDDCLLRGNNYQTSWKRVFGGQVLAQALNAAYSTVPKDRIAHSLHSYFILSGDVDLPIIYQVETIRDGGSFTTRRVKASQKGKVIFVMAASFQLRQDGFDHHIDPPKVGKPKSFMTDIEQAETIKDLSPKIYQRLKSRHQNAIEFRPVEKYPFEDFMSGNAERNVWMKTDPTHELSLAMQHQLLAFASDYDLLMTSLYPHNNKVDMTKMFLASLDHAMWFHRDFDFKDWLLYAINSPSASNSRGMGYGSIFDKKGRLVSTVMQEGLIRTIRS